MKAILLPVFCVLASAAWGDSSDSIARYESRFPFVVAADIGIATEFAPGHVVDVVVVRGDRPRLEAGGTYLIQGNFVSPASQPLRLEVQIRTKAGETLAPVTPQRLVLNSASGSFVFFARMPADGAFYLGLHPLSGNASLGALRIRNDTPFLSFVRNVKLLNDPGAVSSMNEIYKPEPASHSYVPSALR